METIDTVTQWFLLIQSTNISVIKIKTHERDVFDDDYKEVWKLVDTILSSRFAKLEQFEIGLRSFRELISEEVQGLCIHMFPELMKKGKLWLGDYFDERSCQVSRLLT